MKLIVVGAGQAGCNIADEFAAMGKWVWENRRLRIFTGGSHDEVIGGVFAVNLGATDLYGLKHIPPNDNHTILLGTTDEFRGRGAGKINKHGAEQARLGSKTIVSTIRDHGEVYQADAILVIASTAGGTGSGSVGVIVDLLKDNFRKPVYAMLALPFHHQYTEPDSVVNTATCLKRVMENSKADAVFLVDNEIFVRRNESAEENYSIINRRIADSFMDLLCVGEETDPRYIGEVLDANDLINILKGPTTIGVSNTAVPHVASSLWGRFKGSKDQSKHFSDGKIEMERAYDGLQDALKSLSIDCEYRDNGEFNYDAQSVLGLYGGPAHTAREEIIEMMDGFLSERVPGAGRRTGTYPGRTSDTIGFTIIISGIGQGATMDRIGWFYTEAPKILSRIEETRAANKKRWRKVNQAADQLPDLL